MRYKWAAEISGRDVLVQQEKVGRISLSLEQKANIFSLKLKLDPAD